MGGVMIELSELHDAAQKAFPADKLKPARDAAWSLIAEMGWLMIRLPEDAGGLGLGREASSALHYELGRVLSTAPLAPALVALHAIAASDTLGDRDGLIERACAGELITMSLTGTTGALGAGDVLDATLAGVADADMASHVLVKLPGLLALVPLDAPGVTVAERALWDESRRLFDVTIAGHALPADRVLARGDAADTLAAEMRAELLLALAADSLGGASAALAMTVDYLKVRRQFDRPLAMFQALKHRIADLKTRVVAAEALLWSRAADGGASDTDFGALKALAGEVYGFVCEEAIQLHGGIGLTDEHQCHLYMKRAMLNAQLGGSADVWNERAGRAALARHAA